jgi:hypothetical protein
MFLRRQLCAVVNRVLVSKDRHNDRVSIARAVIGWVRPRKPLRTSAGASLGVIYGCSACSYPGPYDSHVLYHEWLGCTLDLISLTQSKCGCATETSATRCVWSLSAYRNKQNAPSKTGAHPDDL